MGTFYNFDNLKITTYSKFDLDTSTIFKKSSVYTFIVKKGIYKKNCISICYEVHLKIIRTRV